MNWSGDRARLKRLDKDGGSVIMAPGFKEAYVQFIEAGWNGLACNPEHGGQGLPRLIAAAVQEMWNASNLSFSLCPLLTTGAIEALELVGSTEQKAMYLPNMVHGKWTGTMNLTEPQAGSDLAAIRSRAVPQSDGTYRVFGQKIFITYGDHDMAENIVHLVLARTPGAPAGVKGISLFVVPKYLVNTDGSLGARNDAYCVSVEDKLGIHACPTCVMAFGDSGNFGGGAIGTLVGEENAGLKYMFIMMNAARFAVGLEGMAVAERAYQQALSYARERVQGREITGGKGGTGGTGGTDSVPIIRHPDVRRMLMLMKSQVEAMRALSYTVAAAHDAALHHPDTAEREGNHAYFDLMIPIVKGWLTETGNEVAYVGVQIHGGMGFIEQTGAAQYMRDARITTIYEGTTGIQANDLIGRKIGREGGITVKKVIAQMRETEAELGRIAGVSANANLVAIHEALGNGIAAVDASVDYIVGHYAQDIAGVSAGAVPFLKLMGIVCSGWQMARAALVAHGKIVAGEGDDLGDAFYPAKIITARFFADHVMSAAPGLAHTVIHGGAGVLELAEEQF